MTDPNPASARETSLAGYEILDLLDGLANKSLIQVGEEDSKAHYRLLETIHQYALDQLLLSEEAPQLRDRHLEYFSHLAEKAEPYLQAAEMLAWMDRLERDADNLRAALEWGLRTCSPAALILAKSLIYYWMGSGLGTEGLRWLGTAVTCLPDSTPAESGASLDQAARRPRLTSAAGSRYWPSTWDKASRPSNSVKRRSFGRAPPATNTLFAWL